MQHIIFFSKRILNGRQQRICIKTESGQTVRHSVFVAYLVLHLNGWQTVVVFFGKVNVNIKDAITVLIESY